MILETKEFKNAAMSILAAVDSSDISLMSDMLELVTKDKTLYLNVTNQEYYVQVKFDLGIEEDLHATVNAVTFLKLLSQITSETIEFSIKDNVLLVKGNGIYKIPLIYLKDTMVELPPIVLEHKTVDFNIDTGILNSISTYNSKELVKNVVDKPVQRLYYVDNEGCITFNSGACVNNFTLPKKMKILLSGKVVKLFKLFTTESVKFELGHDQISGDIVQTKAHFYNDNVSITAILFSDDILFKDISPSRIRERAMRIYPHSALINKQVLVSAINRLLTFMQTSETVLSNSIFTFYDDRLVISNKFEQYEETVRYIEKIDMKEPYVATLFLKDIKLALDNCVEQVINFSFGDDRAVVISRGNLYNVIAEFEKGIN